MAWTITARSVVEYHRDFSEACRGVDQALNSSGVGIGSTLMSVPSVICRRVLLSNFVGGEWDSTWLHDARVVMFIKLEKKLCDKGFATFLSVHLFEL